MTSLRDFLALMTLVMTVSGCANLQTGLQILAFEKDERSGITEKQHFYVFFLGGGSVNDFGKNFLKSKELLLSDQIKNRIESCLPMRPARSPGVDRFALGKLIPTVITSAGSAFYQSIRSSIISRQAQIEAASQVQKTIRYTENTSSFRWGDVNCILIIRMTGTGADESVGMAILYRNIKLRNSYVVRPNYFLLNNSIAVTKKGSAKKPASVKVDTALSIKVVYVNPKTKNPSVLDVSTINLPGRRLIFGEEVIACEKPREFARSCELSSEIVPNIPPGASAISVSVSIVESGTSAGTKAQAEAAAKALDALVKPTFDQFVKQIAASAAN